MVTVLRGNDDFDTNKTIIRISSASMVGVNTVDISLPSGYDIFELHLNALSYSGTNTSINGRVSTDNGSTFLAGTNYVWGITFDTSEMNFGELDSSTGSGMGGVIHITGAKDSSADTHFNTSLCQQRNADAAFGNQGVFRPDTVVTDFRLFTSNSANFLTGSYVLYGIVI